MKKLLLFCIFNLLVFGCSINSAVCDSAKNSISAVEKKEIKQAIAAYKAGNYLSCISLLKNYTRNHPQRAIAWYYMGNAYMNISMKQEAKDAFDEVIKLNTVPKLTSYAVQAQLCLENNGDCKYEHINASDVNKLKDDPIGFLTEYHESLQRKAIKSDDVIQIENLINGSYTNNIHPQAQDFILNEKAKIRASQINSMKN